MGSNPGACDEASFDNCTHEQGTLYVPEGSAGAYRNAGGWKNFRNIVEFNPTGIGNAPIEWSESKQQPVYDMQGRRLRQPQRGMNVIGGRKVLVK